MFGDSFSKAMDDAAPQRSESLVQHPLRGTRFKVKVTDIAKFATKNPKKTKKRAGAEYVKLECLVISAEQLPTEAQAELDWDAEEATKRMLGQNTSIFCEDYNPNLDPADNRFFFMQMTDIAVAVGRFKAVENGADVDAVRHPFSLRDEERTNMQKMLSGVVNDAFDPEENAFGGGEIFVDLERGGDEGQYANVKFRSVC